jgi:signal peptidase I
MSYFFNQREIMLKRFWRWLTFDGTREFIILLLMVVLIRTFGFGLYQVPTGSMETTMLVGERFFADKLTPLFSAPQCGDIISFNDPLYQYSKNPVARITEEYFWGPSNWTKRVIGVPGDKIRGVIEDGRPVIYRNGKKLDEPYINKFQLIDIWTDDAKKIFERAQSEVVNYMGKSHIDPQKYQAILENILGKYHLRVSYDPNSPLDRQPFYHMVQEQLIRLDNKQLSLTLPGAPLPANKNPVKQEGASHWNGTDEYYVELDDHHYWVLGDNRLASHDSRFWGPLDGGRIHGKILYRIWSVDSREWLWICDLMEHPIDFWARVRWNRFFQRVK